MNLNKLLWASTAIVALASCQTASDPYMTLETKIAFVGGRWRYCNRETVYQRVLQSQ